MAGLTDDINDKLSLDGYNEHCIVTVKDVKDAVSRLKPGKHDGNLGSASHLKIAGDWKIDRAGSSRRAMAIDVCKLSSCFVASFWF